LDFFNANYAKKMRREYLRCDHPPLFCEFVVVNTFIRVFAFFRGCGFLW